MLEKVVKRMRFCFGARKKHRHEIETIKGLALSHYHHFSSGAGVAP